MEKLTITKEDGTKVVYVPEVKEVKNSVRWNPEYEDDYWFVRHTGCVVGEIWIDSEYDNFRYAQGNVFRTIEEAQAHLDYLNALGRVNMRIEEENGGWRPNWSDDNELKFFIEYYYHGTDPSFLCGRTYSYQNHTPLLYIGSEKTANLIIKECADDLEIIRKKLSK